MLLRGIVDGVEHPLTNPIRDFAWEDFVARHFAPFGVPRFETREAALEAYHSMPTSSAIDCVDSWDVLDRIIIPLLTCPIDSFGLPDSVRDPPEITETFIEDTMLHTFAKLEQTMHTSPRDVRGTVRFLFE